MDVNLTTALVVAGALVAVFVLWKVLASVFGRKTDHVTSAHMHKECAGCGWKGVVSKYHRKCPSCGAELV